MSAVATKARAIVHRTRGSTHGPITRLVSPGDLGEAIKPFVFLDLFSSKVEAGQNPFGMHPHSGIATLTFDLLRCHVVRRPELGRESTECETAHRASLGNTEVHDSQRPVVTQHDVVGLEIAMDDIVPVHVLHRLAR